MSLFHMAIQKGQWLLFENAHLLIQFITNLEKFIDQTERSHPNFRLWLTTDPSPNFPIGFLQKSLKGWPWRIWIAFYNNIVYFFRIVIVVNEPPTGMKLNMRSLFYNMRHDAFEATSHWAYKPILYIVGFFHAVVQVQMPHFAFVLPSLVHFLHDYHVSGTSKIRQMGLECELRFQWVRL